VTNNEPLPEKYEAESQSSSELIADAKKTLAERCKTAGLALEQVSIQNEPQKLRIAMKCGRDTRKLTLWSDESIVALLSIPFENFVFLAGFAAICSYRDGTIEAGVRPLGTAFLPTAYMYRRLFGMDPRQIDADEYDRKIVIEAPEDDCPNIEISYASDAYVGLTRSRGRHSVTLKLSGCNVKTHDSALALLNKVAGAVFFQVDLLVGFPLSLERERWRSGGRGQRKDSNQIANLQYPKTEFQSAPLSLYWYARSAAGMPLLQYLAFYQVIEFYFPIYSQSEAHRKLKSVLKDPTFRGDRDTDVARLLASIKVSRSGSFGDERSQLRATLTECLELDDLRGFFENDSDRREFFLTKSKTQPYHRIPLANATADLRDDVASRIYDIRCKIVHTKTDSRDGAIELLLPFSQESEELSLDIELIQHVAQLVLIAGSVPFQPRS
jgi:hypothetical protein